ncbi:MAG: hypothetical protein KDD40_04135 [Bdellovibrionales bacterium]|nr:hypothetical protein [Bdellovibrionales bacterium]
MRKLIMGWVVLAFTTPVMAASSEITCVQLNSEKTYTLQSIGGGSTFDFIVKDKFGFKVTTATNTRDLNCYRNTGVDILVMCTQPESDLVYFLVNGAAGLDFYAFSTSSGSISEEINYTGLTCNLNDKKSYYRSRAE